MVIDVALVEACIEPQRADVDSVELTTGRPWFGFTADRTFTLDGELAEQQDTTCTEEYGDPVAVCSGTLRLPQLGVAFRVESSKDSATVDRLLEGVRVLDGQVGIPGFDRVSLNAQERSGEAYADLLRRQGFVVRTVRIGSDLPRGFVVGASPSPGTVVDAGSEVIVEVSGGR